jgi:hypothetical protein
LETELQLVRNTVAELKIDLKKADDDLNLTRRHLIDLANISRERGGDATVRIEGETFKVAEVGFLKNISDNGRCSDGNQAAAELLGESGLVSASRVEGYMVIDDAINRENKAEILERFNAASRKLEDLENSLDRLGGNTEKAQARAEAAKKASAATADRRNDFAMLYQTDAGARAINEMSRSMFGDGTWGVGLAASDVISEYKSVHGDHIFDGSNNSLPSSIEALCSELPWVIDDAANGYYTPSPHSIESYRGQCMTKSGVAQLISQLSKDSDRNNSTVYRAGQFFSTSADPKIASDFDNQSKDEEKVMFNITGNSGGGVFPPKGVAFEHKAEQRLYSPLARFEVKDISREKSSGILHIWLKETSRESTSVLPN